MEILFWRHQTNAQKKIKRCTLQCRLTIDGQRADIGSTHIEINYSDFDTKRQEVTENNPDFVLLNLRLQEEYKTPILNYYTELRQAKLPITSLAIKERFFKVAQTNIVLLDAFEAFLYDFENKTKPKKNKNGKEFRAKRSKSTLRPLRTCRNKLSDYLHTIRQQQISIGELSADWFSNYREWLEDFPHEQSYVVKQLNVLRQVTSFAKKKGLCSQNPFENCEVEPGEEKKPNFLDLEQFEIWKNYKFQSPMAQQVADVFTVFCRTGFHYTDLKQVIRNPSKYIEKGIDGTDWIMKPREKTEVTAKMPFQSFPEVVTIIEKYGGIENLPIKENHIMNMWLKICVAEVNLYIAKLRENGSTVKLIYDLLSVKHGRCTLSDWWINELGNKDDDLLPLLGRKTKDGLSRYVRPDERSVARALKLDRVSNNNFEGN